MTVRIFASCVCIVASSLVVWGAADDAAREIQRQQERTIDQRNHSANGITVSEPKVFDDSLLQQMLNAAEAKLASMQVLDASGLSSKLGAMVGAQQTINSLAVSAQSPSLPGVSTVANGATGSAVNTTAVAPTGTTTTTQTTSGLPATNVTTLSLPSVRQLLPRRLPPRHCLRRSELARPTFWASRCS